MLSFIRAHPRTFALIREVVLASRWVVLAYLASRLLESVAGIVLPVLLKWETDQLAQTQTPLFAWISAQPFRVLLAILGAVAVLRLVQYVLAQAIAIFEGVRAKAVDDALMLRLYARFAEAEIGLFLHARNALVARKALGKSSLICHHVKETLGRSTFAIITCCGLTGMLAVVNPLILAAILAGALVAALAQRAERRLRATFATAADLGYGWRIATLEGEFARNLPQLVANDGQRQFLELLGRQMAFRLRESASEARRKLVYGWASFLTGNVVEIAVKVGVGYGVFYAGASVGTVVLAIMCVDQFRQAISGLVDVALDWRSFRIDVQEIELFLETTEPRPGKTATPPAPQEVVFTGVDFAYPGIAPATLRYLDIQERELRALGTLLESDLDRLHEFAAIRAEAQAPRRPVLEGIDLVLRRGEMAALVGANGAGKTTLTALLLDHFDGYQGSIRIDGQPAAGIARAWFREHIAVVHQVPYLLESLSVRENLLLGVRTPRRDDELWAVLERLGLAAQVRAFRRGLDAECNADAGLSGGQKQLVAIARVLLQDRAILVLDEGTNQLDPDKEQVVMDALLERRRQRIVLCITHRMAAVRRADRIHCLEGGRIVCAGDHATLLAAGDNPYARYWRAQMG